MKRTLTTTLVLCTLLHTTGTSAQGLTVTLTPSNYNGFEVSCAGGRDGAIDLTVTGGTPPYTYTWSTAETTQDIADLPAGYYRVGVTDANAVSEGAQITLTEPEGLKPDVTVNEFPNGYNISCYNCYNGSIQVTSAGGVGPYTYLWSDGNTQEDRTGLGSDNYSVVVTDANGCQLRSDVYYLRQPESNDWKMGGNAGTNPATQFIGTTDNQDVVFKTNGNERFRLLANGALKAPPLASGGGYGLLVADEDGLFKILDGTETALYTEACQGDKPFPWLLCGNTLLPGHFLGSTNAQDVVFKTNGVEQVRIDISGKVGIGTLPPNGPMDQYRLYVDNGIVTRDVLVKVGAWPDYVFDARYELMPLDKLRAYLSLNKHLPGIPSAADVKKKNGVEVGDLQARMLKVMEEQALYILQLKDQLAIHEQRTKALETPQR